MASILHIAERLSYTPINEVIDLNPKPGFDSSEPRPFSLEYWTDTADPASIEGFNFVFEYQDAQGVLQTLGGVPIPVSVDVNTGARQNIPLQNFTLWDLTLNPSRIARVTLSVSAFDPYGVGSAKVSWRLTWQPPETINYEVI